MRLLITRPPYPTPSFRLLSFGSSQMFSPEIQMMCGWRAHVIARNIWGLRVLWKIICAAGRYCSRLDMHQSRRAVVLQLRLFCDQLRDIITVDLCQHFSSSTGQGSPSLLLISGLLILVNIGLGSRQWHYFSTSTPKGLIDFCCV